MFVVIGQAAADDRAGRNKRQVQRTGHQRLGQRQHRPVLKLTAFIIKGPLDDRVGVGPGIDVRTGGENQLFYQPAMNQAQGMMPPDHIHYQRKIRVLVPKLPGKLAGGSPRLQADMQCHARFYVIFNGLF